LTLSLHAQGTIGGRKVLGVHMPFYEPVDVMQRPLHTLPNPTNANKYRRLAHRYLIKYRQ
jgi:hypothetical protein